jgi:flavorubredoxin
MKAIELSEKFADHYMQSVSEKSKMNILIAYVSAYGYTKEAAHLVAEGILETEGLTVDITDIENIPLEELESKLIMSDGLLIGSPTINQNTLLPVYKLFALINPIRDKGKLGGAFGSYGWSGEAPKIIIENLRSLKFKIFEEPAAFKFYPSGSKEEMLRDFGRRFAEKFEEECVQKEKG